jgi:hypothetical protein
MFASIVVLDKWLHMPVFVVESIQEMRKAFHVLYQFDFKSEMGQQKLQWYKENIVEVSNDKME